MPIVQHMDIFPIHVPVSSSLRSINFYLVQSGQSLILIDAGYNNDDCRKALVDTLKQNEFALKDLTHIILTHHHIDHAGLVNCLTAEHPIPVYAHPLSFPRLKRASVFLQMRIQFFQELYETMGCGQRGKKQIEHLKKTMKENESQKITAELVEVGENFGDHFEVLEVPGHAPDQIALYDRKQERLFAGDLLISHISSNALVEPDENGKRIPSLLIHIDSLKKCLSLSLEQVYSGHGKVIQQPKELIQKRLDGIEKKAERFLTLIKGGKRTANDIAETYYKDVYDQQFPLVMSEVIGHLDYLEQREKIQKEKVHGIWRYTSS
ncbi:MBL fold metallo-hydrolase [Siminovitchia sp. FSL W7-1587]|uniref:MBL fold metallo-hydrolase n=1 Tax=Siminovitchia sp. FSL W7-1587 TaxID=2954699 RepID=UPI0030CF1796